jgi:hypothetical protein
MFMPKMISSYQALCQHKRQQVIAVVILLCWTTLALTQSRGNADYSYTPSEGFVPNSKTAVSIGESVLIPIYGIKEVRENEPFSAKLTKGIWVVQGKILPRSNSPLRIEISKRTGCILRVTAGE